MVKNIKIFWNYGKLKLIPGSGVVMSGTILPMSTGVPVGTNQNFKILGTTG